MYRDTASHEYESNFRFILINYKIIKHDIKFC